MQEMSQKLNKSLNLKQPRREQSCAEQQKNQQLLEQRQCAASLACLPHDFLPKWETGALPPGEPPIHQVDYESPMPAPCLQVGDYPSYMPPAYKRNAVEGKDHCCTKPTLLLQQPPATPSTHESPWCIGHCWT
mmetsp:Transcript_36145/g.60345  ORF Transcript_36145/g.60345 Transcript_36145/m.60345 type:complete len:133 (+) Transcript_36145:290-688(+)